MKRYQPISALLLLALLSACGGGQGGPAVEQKDNVTAAAPIPPSVVVNLEGGAVLSAEEGREEILSLEYNLGRETHEAMPIQIRGRLSLPKEGGDLPLVLLLHGAHDSTNPDAGLYEGFSYLAEALARRGYAVASLDVQSAYVWEYGKGDDDKKIAEITARQLGYFERANQGEPLFPVDLTGRLDLERLILVGHSRGGDTALELANSLDGVIGAMAVAPGLREAEKEWRDVPVAILIPELDGDIIDLDGYAYLYTRYLAAGDSPTVATLLKNANHNYFNSMLKVNDAEQSTPDRSHQLTPEAQRAFLCQYLADFCDSVTDQSSNHFIFDLARPVPTMMYGTPVENLFVSPKMTLLSDFSLGMPVSPGCRAQRLTVDTHTTDIRVPLAWGTDHRLTLWRVAWERQYAVAELPLVTDSLNSFDGVALTLAEVGAQPLLLVLEDAAGKCAAVRLPAPYPAAAGAVYTTFSQVRIPLVLFTGVDCSAFTRLALVSEQPGLSPVLVSAVYGYTE